MATDTKPEGASDVDAATRAQLFDCVFTMEGQGTAGAERQVPALTAPKVASPAMRAARPARIRRAKYVQTESPREPAAWRDWIDKVLLVAAVACAAYFLLKATPGSPLYDRRARSTMVASRAPAGPRTMDIEKVQVGDRTLGRNPLREQVDPDAPEPDPKTWRKLVLRMTKASGGKLYAHLLRPMEWIEAAGAEQGGSFFLSLPEMGAVGDAHVEAIETCPPIKPGPGNVVTGTFHHEAGPNTLILRVEFSNGALLEGVTDNHPFWSEDRQDFVPVGELNKGDRVRIDDGITAVTSVVSRPAYPGEMLYNLEVHNEHVYQVTTAGILVHNNCAFSVSSVADDWARKGLHVKVRGIELAVRPGDNATVVFRPVFSSTPSSAAYAAARDMERALRDVTARRVLYDAAIRGREHLRGLATPESLAKSGELTFLVKALEKLGL